MHSTFTLARQDVYRAFKRPVSLSAVLLFGACSMVVLRLSLAGDSKPAPSVLAGALWLVLVFGALIGTSRVWSMERESGSYDALMVSSISRVSLHLGKVLSSAFLTALLNLILLALYLGLFGSPSARGVLLLLAAIILSSFGFACVGALVGGLSLRARGHDLLTPVIFLPLAIPLVIAAVSLSLIAFDSASSSTSNLIAFLAIYDATFLAAGIAAFPELAVD